MASRLRALAPHFLVMLAIYAVVVVVIAVVFDIENFWVSLVIALSIAVAYPAAARRFGIAPEPWQRH